jgi:predicted transcriptional regulator
MRRLHESTHSLVERTGLSLSEFAQRADIDRSILYRIGRPVRGATAWKIANAYATAAGVTPDDAYKLLIVEDGSEPR